MKRLPANNPANVRSYLDCLASTTRTYNPSVNSRRGCRIVGYYLSL
jgi:hypothetical protein